LPSPLAYLLNGAGGVLTIVGVYLCMSWYSFWKGNYKGRLLTDGPYSRVRHPLYLGFVVLTVGLAILIPIVETATLALFSTGVVLLYIRKEEGFLLRRYGKAYRDYMRRVPWRIIPGVH